MEGLRGCLGPWWGERFGFGLWRGLRGCFRPLVEFFLGLGLDPCGGVFLLGVPGGVGSCAITTLPSLPFTLTDWFFNFLWTVLS